MRKLLSISLLVVATGFAALCSPNREETEHVRLSTPVVKAWREIRIGSPVYVLDDAAGKKDWLERALIQKIDFQTGIWYIWVEPGYSVFRIYPYLSKGSPQPSVYQGIVLKVNGTLSVDDLLKAIRSRTPTIKIDEYDVFGPEVNKVCGHRGATESAGFASAGLPSCDVRTELGQIAVPILYIQAKQDRLISAACLAEFRRTKPQITVAKAEGPHLLLQRQQAAETVVRFLRSLYCSDTARAGLYSRL